MDTSYSKARETLASLLDKVTDDRETVIINRRGRPSVAMIAADELSALQETVHLLKSPRNAQRLFEALEEARAGKGSPMTIEDLRREVGLDEPRGQAAR